MDFSLEERVELKKPHACGCKIWIIKRIGADFRIECSNCAHQVMVTRRKFEKAFRKRIGEKE